jgi:hypothetical protein
VHGRSATKRSLSYQTFLHEKGLLTRVPLNLWVTNFNFLVAEPDMVAPSDLSQIQPRIARWLSLQARTARWPSLQATSGLFAEQVFIAFLYFFS